MVGKWISNDLALARRTSMPQGSKAGMRGGRGRPKLTQFLQTAGDCELKLKQARTASQLNEPSRFRRAHSSALGLLFVRCTPDAGH
jgi:hypothetical protein